MGMEQRDREDLLKVGGMIQNDPMNPPLPQTIQERFWDSYPDRLAGKLREASHAREELVDAAVLLMEGYSQSQLGSTKNSEEAPSSEARRNVSRRV